MSGKLIVHGFCENLAFGGKPIKILIDGKEAGTVSKFETTVIDIEKDCSLKLKYGLNTSKPTAVSNHMVTEVQCRAGADRLHADILRCTPYNPTKQNADNLAEMRRIVGQLKNGQLLTSDMADRFDVLRNQMFEATPAMEREAVALQSERDAIWNQQLAEMEAEKAIPCVAKEHRMRCNVCGHIFCYTDADVKENASNASMGAIAAIGGLASALGGGSIFHTHHLAGQADRYTDKIVDYSRCPSCKSTDISEMKAGEEQQKQNNEAPRASSHIEEIKQYKELLDMGIITQEEFDVKKKQLLGL